MKKPKPKKIAPPPTPEQRLATLLTERNDLIARVAQRERLGDFDANSSVIRDTLYATIDIIDYLISINERDSKREQGVKTQRRLQPGKAQ